MRRHPRQFSRRKRWREKRRRLSSTHVSQRMQRLVGAHTAPLQHRLIPWACAVVILGYKPAAVGAGAAALDMHAKRKLSSDQPGSPPKKSKKVRRAEAKKERMQQHVLRVLGAL